MRTAIMLITSALLLAACDRNEPRTDNGAGIHPAVSALQGDATLNQPDTTRIAAVRQCMEAVRPLHRIMGPARAGDWLATYHEPGQTFAEYLACEPIFPSDARRAIHVLPIGRFTATQRRVIALAAEYIHLCYGLPVAVDGALPSAAIPRNARRRAPRGGTLQIRTSWIIDSLLYPRLPRDAMSLIAFTDTDLWPGDDMNFVFGQGSTRLRTGVWSLFRFGSPNATRGAFTQLLARTLKCSTHELGHMFSMLHCTRYECNMNGCNSLEEMDRHPLAFCPECAAKIWWATGIDPRERCATLAGFCERHGLAQEAALLRMELNRLTASHR
ncbi:MAG TPA: archaemetzincin [Candidatus Kapabacteria bacterium]|nr:archaemetzincin [Candidatus Kapabacteria bacterium]